MVWVGWQKVCRPFNEAGLVIKNLEIFNKAFIGKWI